MQAGARAAMPGRDVDGHPVTTPAAARLGDDIHREGGRPRTDVGGVSPDQVGPDRRSLSPASSPGATQAPAHAGGPGAGHDGGAAGRADEVPPPASAAPPPPLHARERLLLDVLRKHVGPKNAILQLELAEAVGYRTGNANSKCRNVQKLIDSLCEKRDIPIFTSCRRPMGVFIATCPEETEAWFARMANRIVSEAQAIAFRKRLVARAFEGSQPRLFPSDPSRSASGPPGNETANSEPGRNGDSGRRPCACGCGIWFRPGVYNQRYIRPDHKDRHEARFYRIGKAVVEAGLEEVFS